MENKKSFSVLKTVIAVVAVLFIIVSLALNVAFSNGKTPHIFGRYIYVVDRSPLGENVTQGAALLAGEVTPETELIKGDIVLCNIAGQTAGLQVRSIYDIVDGGNGAKRYAVATSLGPEKDANGDMLLVSREDIPALCTGNPESLELGKFISFSTSIKGIILELILPCVILVIFLIIKIASSGDEEKDRDYDFYEFDEQEQAESKNRPVSHARNSSPLFEASQEIQPSDEFERKKMSIAENFSHKQVNPDSPYQREKERTMQFKVQGSAESSFAARNMGGQSSTAPTADALREEMLRKTAEAERTGTFSTNLYGRGGTGNGDALDNTGILSKAQLAEMSRDDIPKTTPLRSQSATAMKRKSTSPNIDDILKKSEADAKKKNVSDMSVDDLLKMIEDEKKKL